MTEVIEVHGDNDVSVIEVHDSEVSVTISSGVIVDPTSSYVTSQQVDKIVVCTRAEYDALLTPAEDTLYAVLAE
jgi:hypothetical protein